ncbi:endoplasmic reticulum junction formation protein lunapark-A-like isoform X2 [Acropora millepora]|uniref:endoplasmic reticulum junction formation protein lunapark-A-like isoform X2 n=1 Tax=Acropora millepora TaxID=45264 RepID=UPI001CF27413|nr:endoplasmic reticulum junction formation protein lunapark-A-like isoform X2 [Acropora millepora]
MGILFSRWRKKESLGEVLESLEKDLKALESNLQRTEQLRRKFIGSLVLYSILLYILAALVCYFYDFPKSWKAKIVRSIPLLVFPLVVYSLKRVLHYVFVSRISKKARRLEELKDRKRQVLEEVMEKETYKAAKDLLDKYDPNSEILKVERKNTAPTSPVPAVMQSPQGTIGTELRQRNLSSKTESPGVPALQRTFSEPSLLESPAQLNQSHDSRVVNRSIEVRRSSSLMDITLSKSETFVILKSIDQVALPPASAAKQQPLAAHLPILKLQQPILPRERTAVDKVIEYLVGDGPNNRFALICSQCCSHNGMALKEEFEYTAFRCCYCYHLNPARKQRPVAPKLEFDTWTTPKHASPKRLVSVKELSSGYQEATNTSPTMQKKNVVKLIDKAEVNGDHRQQNDETKGSILH